MTAGRAHPFDAAAAAYDATFSERRLGRWLRAAVQEQLGAAFAPGQWVLEIGCGTGEDAIWLARRGVAVTATDAAPGMLEVARRKAQAAGLAEQIHFAQLDASRPLTEAVGNRQRATGEHDEPQGPHQSDGFPNRGQDAAFDGAFSNFGPLNCMADRSELAASLGRWVRPGGRLLLVVMGPLCPWEIAWHLARGQGGKALRRLRGGALAHVGGDSWLPVWYPSPRRLRREFAPHFRHLETRGIGALLPPSYLAGLVERWPGLFSALALAERRVDARFPWTWLNDHYLMLFERREEEVS